MGSYEDVNAVLEKRLAQAEAALERAVFLAEHLWQMIPQEVWREHGAEWQGQYEGDYQAERVRDELRELAVLSSAAPAGRRTDGRWWFQDLHA